jgi:alkanesulfonate monooxygenase SsuD/methylene tetrahydromethanopterin reductase-like flavin-dependent oxidoreductase (luciferase family)
MKVGIIVEGHEGLSWDAWRRLAAQTEALGFDSFWRWKPSGYRSVHSSVQ